MENTLAKDMFIQRESLAKFYLKLACTIERESIAQLFTYMMGIKMEKLCLYGGQTLVNFFLSKVMGYSLCLNDTWGVMD